MKIKFARLILVGMSIFAIGAAQANTFSFDAVTGLGELTPDSGAKNCGAINGVFQDYCQDLQFTVDGLTATVTATTDWTGTSADDLIPWYDLTPANRGGIGGTNDITDNSTDNSAVGEYVHVTFSAATSLAGAWFNGDHIDVSGMYGIAIDVATGFGYAAMISNSYADFSFANLVGSDFVFWVSSSITSVADAIASATPFYLAGLEVPEPGTLALLSLGLLGVGAARRRRKAAQEQH